MSVRPAFRFLEHDGVLAFAHRGGALEAPENTMAAFQYAAGLGYRYLETDVYATRDGVLLAFHDDRLDRVTDRKGLIERLDYAQVREARIGGGEPIPLLADVLSSFPDARFNIDPKHDRAVGPLIAVLRDLAASDRVCVGSFSDQRIEIIRRSFDGRICTSLGPRGVLWLKAAAMGLPTPMLHAGCVQVPVRTRGIALVTPPLIAVARRLQLQVHVWTIDDADEMAALLDLGVHGLMTDRPSVLKRVLMERGQWLSGGPLAGGPPLAA
ncbi:MAG: glycerophosphodiester phosphodiesterase [Alphaproteobacteria bacterium]|nr:glycerophosphodiester phosphodiesterase [Alphaproteobacteria bacterium]